jgi:hypothetical protein
MKMTGKRSTILESFVIVGSFDCNHTQVTSILRQIIIAREGFSRLGVLSSLLPLSFVDILQTTSGGLDT